MRRNMGLRILQGEWEVPRVYLACTGVGGILTTILADIASARTTRTSGTVSTVNIPSSIFPLSDAYLTFAIPFRHGPSYRKSAQTHGRRHARAARECLFLMYSRAHA